MERQQQNRNVNFACKQVLQTNLLGLLGAARVIHGPACHSHAVPLSSVCTQKQEGSEKTGEQVIEPSAEHGCSSSDLITPSQHLVHSYRCQTAEADLVAAPRRSLVPCSDGLRTSRGRRRRRSGGVGMTTRRPRWATLLPVKAAYRFACEPQMLTCCY